MGYIYAKYSCDQECCTAQQCDVNNASIFVKLVPLLLSFSPPSLPRAEHIFCPRHLYPNILGTYRFQAHHHENDTHSPGSSWFCTNTAIKNKLLLRSELMSCLIRLSTMKVQQTGIDQIGGCVACTVPVRKDSVIQFNHTRW